MPCGGSTSTSREGLLSKLKELVNQIDTEGSDSISPPCEPAPPCRPCSPCGPCGPCSPCSPDFSRAQVSFACPPTIPMPTGASPGKPLKMADAPKTLTPEEMVAAERREYNSRYDNYYNNYNIDYRARRPNTPPQKDCSGLKAKGTVVDGKSPCCEDYMKKNEPVSRENTGGRSTMEGFRPCEMRLHAPPCCSPLGTWRAEIQKPKSRPPQVSQPSKPDVSTPYDSAEECKRPGCKHWKPEGGPCLYDAPCKASCFNHPPGMKPTGRTTL